MAQKFPLVQFLGNANTCTSQYKNTFFQPFGLSCERQVAKSRTRVSFIPAISYISTELANFFGFFEFSLATKEHPKRFLVLGPLIQFN